MKIKHVLLSGFLVFAAASAAANKVRAVQVEGYPPWNMQRLGKAFKKELEIKGTVLITKIKRLSDNLYQLDLQISPLNEPLYFFRGCYVSGWDLESQSEEGKVLRVGECISENDDAVIKKFYITRGTLLRTYEQRRELEPRVFRAD